MKRFYSICLVLVLLLSFGAEALAVNRSDAIDELTAEYVSLMGQDESDNARDRSTREVDAMISLMDSDQYNLSVALDSINTQVQSVSLNSTRKDPATDALERAERKVENFTDMEPGSHLEVIPVTAGALPYVEPDTEFTLAQSEADEAVMAVRRILLNPDRPGAVPEGDLVSDFIPMIIRQLFRFAWLAVFVALTVSGVYFIIAHDDEERLTKAKAMLYWSLIGFAFITLAFAVVKAVTDIDFFRFV